MKYRKSRLGATATAVGVILAILLNIVCSVGLGYVVYHFIVKYW